MPCCWRRLAAVAGTELLPQRLLAPTQEHHAHYFQPLQVVLLRGGPVHLSRCNRSTQRLLLLHRLLLLLLHRLLLLLH
jgi:hypothetical protein